MWRHSSKGVQRRCHVAPRKAPPCARAWMQDGGPYEPTPANEYAPRRLQRCRSPSHFSPCCPPSRLLTLPPRSAKALSKYTDMADAVVREALDKLAGATDAARITLRQVRGMPRRFGSAGASWQLRQARCRGPSKRPRPAHQHAGSQQAGLGLNSFLTLPIRVSLCLRCLCHSCVASPSRPRPPAPPHPTPPHPNTHPAPRPSCLTCWRPWTAQRQPRRCPRGLCASWRRSRPSAAATTCAG
jgi:hypothetical protein